MAAPYTTYDTIGIREDLSDIIERIDPDDTPLYSNCRKSTCSNTLFDWQVQELEAVDGTALAEGFDASFGDLKPTDRLQQVCQLIARTAQVTDTNDAVTAAGRAKESAYQIMLKGLELRRDLETVLFLQQVKAATDPRDMASIHAWITNVENGTEGTGDGTDLPTPAAGTNLTLALIDGGMEQAYLAGGKPSQMYLHPRQKRLFSMLSGVSTNEGIATQEVSISASAPREGVAIGAVSIYLTDFGRLDCVVDRFMPNDEIALIDPNYIEMCSLPGRSFKQTPLAKTGSSTKSMIEYEGAVKMNAPKAHATIIALNTAVPPV